FAAALIAGLRAVGISVIDIGQVPTPVMYFAVAHLGADGGAVVSASHNPPEYNGVKLRRAHPAYGSEPLPGDAIQAICRLANAGPIPDAATPGTYAQANIDAAYVASVARQIQLKRPFTIVLDGGNGVAGPLGVQAFEAVGARVLPLFIEPDGRFPNHHPDPLKEENLAALKRAVVEQRASLGIALDGDGDRLGVVDADGAMVFADRALIPLAQVALARGPAPVVFDVKCSTVLEEAVRGFGGTPVMGKTGYVNLSATMRETGAALGGELSGHIIATNAPLHNYDDGIFAGASLLHAIAALGGTLAALLAPYPALPSLPEDRLHFSDDTKFAAIDHLREQFVGRYRVIDIDGVRIDFGDGWGLVRASNTEPAITTRFEARSLERVREIRTLMLGALESFRQ
ncbi:MAG: phosphomannomutase/phosphoglucomutase, partial [Chloroflexales bacterium]|nr:phosphomannomutase/phosphoglucomutase [Chloroflexales bacterium]